MRNFKPIFDFSFLANREPLFVLTKKKSPDYLEYIRDPYDDWFVHVVVKSRKTQEIKRVSMIIQKDMEHWISWATANGWEIDSNSIHNK